MSKGRAINSTISSGVYFAMCIYCACTIATFKTALPRANRIYLFAFGVDMYVKDRMIGSSFFRAHSVVNRPYITIDGESSSFLMIAVRERSYGMPCLYFWC